MTQPTNLPESAVNDQWRDEIRDFYGRTYREIQHVIRAMSAISAPSSQENSSAPEGDPTTADLDFVVAQTTAQYGQHQAGGHTATSNHPQAVDHQESDLDDSRDRLANLKRQLAAKLSGQDASSRGSQSNIPGNPILGTPTGTQGKPSP